MYEYIYIYIHARSAVSWCQIGAELCRHFDVRAGLRDLGKGFGGLRVGFKALGLGFRVDGTISCTFP